MGALDSGGRHAGGVADQLYRPQYTGFTGAHDSARYGAEWAAVRVYRVGLFDCLLGGEPDLGADSGPRRVAPRDDGSGLLLDGGLGGACLRGRTVELRGGARGAGVRRRRDVSGRVAHGGADPARGAA